VGIFSSLRVPSVSAVDAINADSRTVLLDVREKSEWNAGHAPGALHIPLGNLSGGASRLPQDKKIYVVCRSGNRSRSATGALRQAGYDAYNVSGGMQAWAGSGGRVLNRSNRPGQVI
jgi:rhodanese-related sulfurtransferase